MGSVLKTTCRNSASNIFVPSHYFGKPLSGACGILEGNLGLLLYHICCFFSGSSLGVHFYFLAFLHRPSDRGSPRIRLRRKSGFGVSPSRSLRVKLNRYLVIYFIRRRRTSGDSSSPANVLHQGTNRRGNIV